MTTEDQAEKPAGTSIPLNAVGEEMAAMADFFRQRLLLRAHQVDGLKASKAELEEAVGSLAGRIDALEADAGGHSE